MFNCCWLTSYLILYVNCWFLWVFCFTCLVSFGSSLRNLCNSLHLTTFCLQYKPTVIACVCIHLACKWSNWEIPVSTDGKHWWEYVDPSVTLELLDGKSCSFLTSKFKGLWSTVCSESFQLKLRLTNFMCCIFSEDTGLAWFGCWLGCPHIFCRCRIESCFKMLFRTKTEMEICQCKFMQSDCSRCCFSDSVHEAVHKIAMFRKAVLCSQFGVACRISDSGKKKAHAWNSLHLEVSVYYSGVWI